MYCLHFAARLNNNIIQNVTVDSMVHVICLACMHAFIIAGLSVKLACCYTF